MSFTSYSSKSSLNQELFFAAVPEKERWFSEEFIGRKVGVAWRYAPSDAHVALGERPKKLLSIEVIEPQRLGLRVMGDGSGTLVKKEHCVRILFEGVETDVINMPTLVPFNFGGTVSNVWCCVGLKTRGGDLVAFNARDRCTSRMHVVSTIRISDLAYSQEVATAPVYCPPGPEDLGVLSDEAAKGLSAEVLLNHLARRSDLGITQGEYETKILGFISGKLGKDLAGATLAGVEKEVKVESKRVSPPHKVEAAFTFVDVFQPIQVKKEVIPPTVFVKGPDLFSEEVTRMAKKRAQTGFFFTKRFQVEDGES